MKRKNKRLQRLIHRLTPGQWLTRSEKIARRREKRLAPKVVEKR